MGKYWISIAGLYLLAGMFLYALNAIAHILKTHRKEINKNATDIQNEALIRSNQIQEIRGTSEVELAEYQLSNIVISDGMEAVAMTEDMARYLALAFCVKSEGDICSAPTGLCVFCPVKRCNYEEAKEYMKEYCK